MIAQRETACVAQSLLQKAESGSSAIFLLTHDDPNNRFSLFRIMLYQRIISRNFPYLATETQIQHLTGPSNGAQSID
jgi:hypothetical protein